MQARRLWGKIRGFTLLELLIVVSIIAILVTMVITTLAGARRRASVAVARSNIQAIKAALAMYESDTGRYPCRQNKPVTANANLYFNDIAYAWAGLRNRPTQPLQGGPNSPYLEWKVEQVGIPAVSTFDSDNTFGTNAGATYQTPIPPGVWANQLPAGDNNWNLPVNDTNAPAGSIGSGGEPAHLPVSGVPFVFLDPWGNPYWYIEWASIPTTAKDGMIAGTSITSYPIGATSTGTPSGEPHVLTPHDTAKFDIWSFGPNGVNEAGDGDDVASWSDQKKN